MRFQKKDTDHNSIIYSSQINILLVVAFLWDLLTPFLIWKGILPTFSRWVSDAVILLIIVLTYLRMLTMNRIPYAVLVITVLLMIGITVAFLNGQSIRATVWGSWLMFRYPLAGVFVYLQPAWFERIFMRLRTICIAILSFEVLFQIGQYWMGEHIGDNLAGTFGIHGTGPLLEFTMFVLCLLLAQLVVEQRWIGLGWVMILGSISSILGEIKFFLPASLILLSLGFILFIIQKGQLWKIVLFAISLGSIVLVFVTGFNTFVPGAETRPIESFLLNKDVINSYLNTQDKSSTPGVYYMGRNQAVQYGWDTISRDPLTLFFGMGLGARSESRSLGVAGIAFSGNASSLLAQGGLIVLIQEFGLIGLCTLGIFILWIVVLLSNAIRYEPESPSTEMRYALILFSLFLPLWLFYTNVWNHEALMLLYWTLLGYVLAESSKIRMQTEKQSCRIVVLGGRDATVIIRK